MVIGNVYDLKYLAPLEGTQEGGGNQDEITWSWTLLNFELLLYFA